MLTFKLKNCFTEQNNMGFENFINLSYNNYQLEILEHLDISDNYFGTSAQLEKLLAGIGTSKGLLNFAMAAIPFH